MFDTLISEFADLCKTKQLMLYGVTHPFEFAPRQSLYGAVNEPPQKFRLYDMEVVSAAITDDATEVQQPSSFSFVGRQSLRVGGAEEKKALEEPQESGDISHNLIAHFDEDTQKEKMAAGRGRNR